LRLAIEPVDLAEGRRKKLLRQRLPVALMSSPLLRALHFFNEIIAKRKARFLVNKEEKQSDEFKNGWRYRTTHLNDFSYSFVPQSGQNLWMGGLFAPQLVQTIGSCI
jgi:hypothetical protein